MDGDRPRERSLLGKTETSSDGKYVLRDSRTFLMHGERFDISLTKKVPGMLWRR